MYVDFYVPLLYIVIICLVSYFVYKIIFKELIYKFFVDYLAKNVIYKVKNIKFFDLNLNKLNFVNFFAFRTFSNVFIKYIGNFKYNNVIFLIFLIYLVLWDLNLNYKIYDLHS